MGVIYNENSRQELGLQGNNARKPAWAFKLRKQSLSKLGRQESSVGMSSKGFVEHLNNVSVTVGEQCVLSCRVATESLSGCQIVWKGPGGGLLQSEG